MHLQGLARGGSQNADHPGMEPWLSLIAGVVICVALFVPVPPANGQASAGSSNPQGTSKAGRIVYERHCAACHGREGDGDGPAAVWLFPKPRDFSAGLFKIKSTPGGALPTDEDLFETITKGMPGSSMPSFPYLSEQERRDSVAYVKHLTAYKDESGKLVNRFEEARAKGELEPSIRVPPEPPLTFDALSRGKELFAQLQCNACHGETGAGDGPAAASLVDAWGLPLPPRDFNTGAFRGGHTGRDLYLRIAAGMPGTPMPPYGDDVMKPGDRWALVTYIQSLRRKDVEVSEMLAPEGGIIKIQKTRGKLPVDPAAPEWDPLIVRWIPLNPLWPAPGHAPALAFRALHDGKRVAILAQWRDTNFNGAQIAPEDFQDAVAIQFSLKETTPFLGMGDADNPVNIWQWRAGWQQEMDGPRPDVDTRHPSMHVDLYPEQRALFRVAEAAGNLVASTGRKSPVEDSNAAGFGTLRSQSEKEQNVSGKGIWRDGHWQVVFVRELKSGDAGDVKLVPGKAVPVAFAVWDGEQRDRNGKKLISNWHQLILEP